MSTEAEQLQQEEDRQARRRSGIFAAPLLIIRVLLYSFAGAILIEWVCMIFFWPEQGAAHSEAVLRHELDYLHDTHQYALTQILFKPFEWAIYGVNTLTHFWQWSGLARAGDYALSALFTLQTNIVRLCISTLSIPFFIFCAIWGMLEGLIIRDLRRFGGMPDFDKLYHTMKKITKPSLVIPFLLYMCLPIAVWPLLIIVPFALFVGFIILIRASRFTKFFWV